jgi:hypothetical protein
MPFSDANVAHHETRPHGPLAPNHIASSTTSHAAHNTHSSIRHSPQTFRCCSVLFLSNTRASAIAPSAPMPFPDACIATYITEIRYFGIAGIPIRVVLTRKVELHQAAPWMKQEREQRIQSLQTTCQPRNVALKRITRSATAFIHYIPCDRFSSDAGPIASARDSKVATSSASPVSILALYSSRMATTADFIAELASSDRTTACRHKKTPSHEPPQPPNVTRDHMPSSLSVLVTTQNAPHARQR